MSTILTAYNLAGGATQSSTLTNVKNIRIQALLTTVSGYVRYVIQVKDGAGDWVNARKDNGDLWQFSTRDSNEQSINIIGINATSLRVAVYPDNTTTGTLSIVESQTATDTGVLTDGSAMTQVVNASGDNLFVSTPIREISATLTRHADTENYTANDHISAAVDNVKQKETVSLTGTSGTANITGTAGLTKLVTFATAGTQDLAQTAADFVTSHEAAYDALGIAVTAATTTIVFESKVAGVPFTAPTITNVTTDLAGTVAHTTPNVTLVPVILDDMVADLGEGGIIMDVEVNTTITQLAGQTLRIWLFNATPSGIVGDNVAFTTLVANASKMVGSAYIDVELNALLTGSDCIVGKVSPAVAFKCADADNTLYALIQTLGAATAPTSAGVINIKFTVMQITK